MSCCGRRTTPPNTDLVQYPSSENTLLSRDPEDGSLDCREQNVKKECEKEEHVRGTQQHEEWATHHRIKDMCRREEQKAHSRARGRRHGYNCGGRYWATARETPQPKREMTQTPRKRRERGREESKVKAQVKPRGATKKEKERKEQKCVLRKDVSKPNTQPNQGNVNVIPQYTVWPTVLSTQAQDSIALSHPARRLLMYGGCKEGQ
ncbi:hypothetical protein B0H14DRAFT_2597740 [Mycena olivaceomarginata]|nr:hypothetical protein B0H14DRAFT_2597740 [Mycena olivaceomarginata]